MLKGDRKKQAILDAAERLFYQKGFEKTSVQDILDILACSKGSFYHHFESKHAVLETLCQQRISESLIVAQAQPASEREPLAQLDRLLYYACPLRRGEERFLTLLLPMTVSEDGARLCAQLQQAIMDDYAGPVARTLADCAEHGQAFCKYPHRMARILLALVNLCWKELAEYIVGMKNAHQPILESDLLEIVQTFRFSVERLTDLPFGSIDLIRLEELTQVAAGIGI